MSSNDSEREAAETESKTEEQVFVLIPVVNAANLSHLPTSSARNYRSVYQILVDRAGDSIQTMSVEELQRQLQPKEPTKKTKRADLARRISKEDKTPLERAIQSMETDFSSPATVEMFRKTGITHFKLLSVTRETYEKIKKLV